MKIKKKHLLYWIVSIFVLLVIITQVCYWTVALNSKDRLYDSVSEIPYNDVGMVLGTGPKTKSGRTNLFFQYRIDAAEALYKAGKIKFILISGDNSRNDYSEPDVMKDSLIHRGIPADVIYLDYAGFRTWDSVIRAKEIFGQTKMTVISQRFHNERSIFIGNHFGMKLIGFNAKDASAGYLIRAYIRENLARVKIFVDLLIGKQPYFSGTPIEIGEGKPQIDINTVLKDKNNAPIFKKKGASSMKGGGTKE